jgi:predicted transcriptional regulator
MNDNDYPIQLFSALSNQTRWKMLQLLEQKPVRSIAELARIFKLSHVAAVKHVAVLEKVELIFRSKVGKYHNIQLNFQLWQQVKLALLLTKH